MFYNATNSLAASDVMTTVLLINFTAAAVGATAAASRQLWAFARNGGVPFSRFFAPVCTLSQLLALANFSSLIFHIIFLSMQLSSLYLFLL
jgi:amino acid permease